MNHVILNSENIASHDLLTILLIGIAATTYQLAFQRMCKKHRWIKPNLSSAVGSTLIPEASPKTLLALLAVQYAMGIVVAGVYSFIFHFLTPSTLMYYLGTGVMIGTVHGMFISFFTTFGFSRVSSKETNLPTVMVLNIALQAVFGGIVGLGLGYGSLTGDFWKFLVQIALISVILFGAEEILMRRRSHFSHHLTPPRYLQKFPKRS